jgi:membrane protease YdiL (CAAX protease family)
MLLLAVALMAAIYFATFQTTTIIIFPAVLLVGGLCMEYMLERRKGGFKTEDQPETNTSSKSMVSTGYYSIIVLCGLLIASSAINLTGYLSSLSFTGSDALLYSVLMAIAETQFFIGFIADWFLSFIKVLWPWGSIFASAGVFAAYHLARYSTDFNALAYVFFGGLILTWVSYRTKRLGPAMLGHSMANVISVLLGGV